MYIGSVSSVVNFGGQTSKNGNDVRKACLETTLCVYACFVEFYLFVLDEVYVGGPKKSCKNIFGLETSRYNPM